MEVAVIATYRCFNKCEMCHTWKYPSKEEEEFKPSLLEKLTQLVFCSVTGGEPFLRDDFDEIISILWKKVSKKLLDDRHAGSVMKSNLLKHTLWILKNRFKRSQKNI